MLCVCLEIKTILQFKQRFRPFQISPSCSQPSVTVKLLINRNTFLIATIYFFLIFIQRKSGFFVYQNCLIHH